MKIYLATPYSHHERAVRVLRFERVNKIAAILMARGEHVFSPISHTHPIAESGNLPGGWDYWAKYDRSMIEWADYVLVFTQEDWLRSQGVLAEMRIAQEMKKNVMFVNSKGQITTKDGLTRNEELELIRRGL